MGRVGGGGGVGDDDNFGDDDGCGDAGIGGGGGEAGGCGEYGPTCPLFITAIGAGRGLAADRCMGGGASRGSGEAGGEPDTVDPPNTASRCTISHFVSSLIAFACDATVAKSLLSIRGRMRAGPNAYASLSTLI